MNNKYILKRLSTQHSQGPNKLNELEYQHM